MDGVSDDVLVFAGVIFSITVLVLWATRSRPQTVHLSLETWIQTVRTRVSGAPPEANAAADQNAPGPTGPNENQCPICFENWNTVNSNGVNRVRTALSTNCGHWFCVICCRTMHEHPPPGQSSRNPISCPICRTGINLFVASRAAEGAPAMHDSDATFVARYNRSYSGQAVPVLPPSCYFQHTHKYCAAISIDSRCTVSSEKL